MKSTILLVFTLFLFAGVVRAQVSYMAQEPYYCCGPRYSFCAAKYADNSTVKVAYGFFAYRDLADSECNNEGNKFFGNTIKIRTWSRSQVFWYDWSADPDAGVKIAVWSYAGWSEPLTVIYNPYTMMALKVTSPSFPE